MLAGLAGLAGSELLACADNVTRDGAVDATELIRFATHCFVPAGVDESVMHRMAPPGDRVWCAEHVEDQ